MLKVDRDPMHSTVPDELWLRFLRYLDIVSITMMGATCRRYNRISKDLTLWKNLVFDWENVRSNLPVFKSFFDKATMANKVEKTKFNNKSKLEVNNIFLASLVVKSKESLKVLIFSSSMKIRNVALEKFGCLTKLEVLDMTMDPSKTSSKKVTTDGVKAIAKMKNLKELRIQRCDKVPEEDLIHLFNELKNLVVVDMYNPFHGTVLTDGAVKILARNNPNLEHLNLAQSLHHFEYLDNLVRSDTKADTLKDLAQNCPKFHHLNAELFWKDSLKALIHFKKLRYLLLGDSKLSDDTLQKIAKRNNELKHLNLGGCEGVQDGGVRAIIQHCPNIEYLHLAHTSVSKEVILEVVMSCKELTNLYLSGIIDVTYEFINNLKKEHPHISIFY